MALEGPSTQVSFVGSFMASCIGVLFLLPPAHHFPLYLVLLALLLAALFLLHFRKQDLEALQRTHFQPIVIALILFNLLLLFFSLRGSPGPLGEVEENPEVARVLNLTFLEQLKAMQELKTQLLSLEMEKRDQGEGEAPVKSVNAAVKTDLVERWCELVIRRTRKVDGLCPFTQEEGIQPRQLLVTGTGRSGTSYTADYFVSSGVFVRHEKLGTNGSVSWLYAFDDQGLGYPWDCLQNTIGRRCDIGNTRFSRVFHLVRHPLKSIPSLRTYGGSSWAFINEVTGVANSTVPWHKEAEHWYTWNAFVELYAEKRFRIEDAPFQQMCLEAGFGEGACEEVPELEGLKSNRRKVEPLGWEDLAGLDGTLLRNLKEMTVRYGYSLEHKGWAAEREEEEEG